MPSKDAAIDAIALLDEPVRRSLYEWIASRQDPISRDQAAKAVGIGRPLAAFHLDRMERDGLLVAEYRRLNGRTGPGAGRPSKLYRRAPGTISLSLPQRDYGEAARLLAEALERTSGEAPSPAARAVAHEEGVRVGEAAARDDAANHGGTETAAVPAERKTVLLDALRERGYEPREETPGQIIFGNCPFDALVDEHRPLVCGMNLALAEGVLEGFGGGGYQAELDQRPGRCCVTLREDAPPN